MICAVKVTGQQLKDALEMGVRNLPEESGGFLQVSGMTYTVDTSVPSGVQTDDQFVCKAWFNLKGRRAYALINPDCTNTERVNFVTPFGQYTPRKRDILSLEQLKTAVREYFSNLEEADFLAKVPHEKIEM